MEILFSLLMFVNFGCDTCDAVEVNATYAQANISDGFTLTTASSITVTGFAIYSRCVSGSCSIGVALYNMSGGVPTTRATDVHWIGFSTGSAWYDTTGLSINLGAGTYCMAMGEYSAGGNNREKHSDSTAAGSYYSDATLPSTWSHTVDTWSMNMYCTYTADGVVKRFGVLK